MDERVAKCFTCNSRTLKELLQEFRGSGDRKAKLCPGCVQTAIRQAIDAEWEYRNKEWKQRLQDKGSVVYDGVGCR